MLDSYSEVIRARIVNASRLILDIGGTVQDAFPAAKRAGYAGSPEELDSFLKEAGPIVRSLRKRGRRKKAALPTEQKIINGRDGQMPAVRIYQAAREIERCTKIQKKIVLAAEAVRKMQPPAAISAVEAEIESRAKALISKAIEELQELL